MRLFDLAPCELRMRGELTDYSFTANAFVGLQKLPWIYFSSDERQLYSQAIHISVKLVLLF